MDYFYSQDLRHFSQQTADAICAVMHMQVTIVDQDVRTIAGTGCFAQNVSSTLPPNYVFARVISSGEVCLLEDPGRSIYCSQCADREACKEKATLMVPVWLEGKVIGGIGLAAMTEEDRERLLENSVSLTNFMVKMADLLAAKVKSELAIRDILVLKKQLETVTDTFTEGIISINAEGRVTHFNRHAELILKIEQSSILHRDYRDKLYCSLFEDGLKRVMDVENMRTTIAINGTELPVLMSVCTIVYEGQIQGLVAFFQEISMTKKKYEQILMSNARYTFDSIHGESRQIRTCIDMAKRISVSNSSVLILGESGTGKELFARAIHNASHRRHNNFVAINCSAIPDNLLESELFGYVQGAFTGASKEGHMGKFEVANGGTIFLDEIGDMPLKLQSKMLRVLQERMVERVGSSVSIPIDVRVIAATNRNLEQMVKEKTFRQDLYYRINVIPIKIPPLRERIGDIQVISAGLMNKYSLLLGKKIQSIDEDVMELFCRYCWPGNIRELENVIEYAINMELGHSISKESLPPYLEAAVLAKEKEGFPSEDGARATNSDAAVVNPETGTPAASTVFSTFGVDGGLTSYRVGRTETSQSQADTSPAITSEPGIPLERELTLKDVYNESYRQKILDALSKFEDTTEGKRECARYLNISLSTLYRKMKELGIK